MLSRRLFSLSIVAVWVCSSRLLSADDGFDRHLAPLLTKYCVNCHDAKPIDTTLSLTGRSAQNFTADAVVWKAVHDRLQKDEMPPIEARQPSAGERNAAVAWLIERLEKVGAAASVGLMPSDGNKVDHDALFHAPNPPPLDNPPRLWRLNVNQYMQWADDVTRAAHLVRASVGGVIRPFPMLDDTGFRDYALVFPLDEPTTDQLIRNAQNIATIQTGFRVKQGKKSPNLWNKKIPHNAEIARLCFPDLPMPTRDEMQAGVRAEFNFALLREPTDEELLKYTYMMVQKVAAYGRDEGIRTTLAMILLLPEAIFRSERGAGPPDAQGRVMLTPREIAFALAYAFGDRRPNETIMGMLQDGHLSTEHDVRRAVRELLDDPAFSKERIIRFFQEYFGYTRALEIFKDEPLNPDHDALIMVRDTDTLVKHILEQDRDVLRELLTTQKSFVQIIPRTKTEGGSQKAGTRKVWLSYNLPARPEAQPAEMPAAERCGILTQPSWLVAWSGNTENHPIHKGKWIREKLLGGFVPDVPIGVDAKLPDDPHKTLRERMVVTNDAKCAHCHKLMNPLGLPFEQYDHFGRFRTTELNRPVEVGGVILSSGEPSLDGAVASPQELVRKLADSPRVRQVFVRHAFRYWMGRNENLGDARTLRAADEAYVESGGSMKALITSLLTSESFLYRTPRPQRAEVSAAW